jgi:hypothetical protein
MKLLWHQHEQGVKRDDSGMDLSAFGWVGSRHDGALARQRKPLNHICYTMFTQLLSETMKWSIWPILILVIKGLVTRRLKQP